MMLRLVFVVVPVAAALAAGCFNPKFKDQIACGPQGECPPGQSCGVDQKCHPPGDAAGDSRSIDAPGDSAQIDAGPDATPVECNQDADCQTPPDACSMPGTCDLATNRCVFPTVDCSGQANQCNDAGCDPARGCIKVPARQDLECGQGNVCGAFGACGGFDGTCDSTGTQSRSCTMFTCQSGTCTGTDSTDTQACTRSTNGTTCATTEVTGCDPCSNFSDICDETGTATCTCTDMVCMNDTCTAVAPRSCPQDCSRSTTDDQICMPGCGDVVYCCRNQACIRCSGTGPDCLLGQGATPTAVAPPLHDTVGKREPTRARRAHSLVGCGGLTVTPRWSRQNSSGSSSARRRTRTSSQSKQVAPGNDLARVVLPARRTPDSQTTLRSAKAREIALIQKCRSIETIFSCSMTKCKPMYGPA